MERTQIYLDPEQRRFLETMAFVASRKSNKRVTMSELIRQAVDDLRIKHGDFQDETDLILQSAHLMDGIKEARSQSPILDYDDVFGDE